MNPDHYHDFERFNRNVWQWSIDSMAWTIFAFEGCLLHQLCENAQDMLALNAGEKFRCEVTPAGEQRVRDMFEQALSSASPSPPTSLRRLEAPEPEPSLEIACTPCADGFFKPGIGADACTPKKTDCPVGEYLTASTDKTSDATCTEMKTDCPAGEYFTASTDKTSDATCTACAAAEFKEGVNAITSCTPKKTNCTASEYLEESPDSTTDSTCTPLPPGSGVAVSFTLSIAAPTTRRLRSLDTIDLDEIMTAVIDSFATLASPVTVTSEQIALEDLGDDKVRVTIVPAAGQTAAEIKTAATATNNDQIEFLVTLGAELGSGRSATFDEPPVEIPIFPPPSSPPPSSPPPSPPSSDKKKPGWVVGVAVGVPVGVILLGLAVYYFFVKKGAPRAYGDKDLPSRTATEDV